MDGRLMLARPSIGRRFIFDESRMQESGRATMFGLRTQSGRLLSLKSEKLELIVLGRAPLFSCSALTI